MYLTQLCGSPRLVSGPSGLMAAHTLAQNGVTVRIIEKSTTNRIGQHGAGITIRLLPKGCHLSRFFSNLLDSLSNRAMKGSIQLPRVAWYKIPGYRI